jgi:hypothetical protein
MIANDQMPDPIRRRLGLPPLANPVVQNIKQELFANSRRYIVLILDASRGEEVDVEELLAVAQRAGKCPAIVNRDLELAVAAYRAWQDSIHP